MRRALPFLEGRLTDGATVILDDLQRPGEREVVAGKIVGLRLSDLCLELLAIRSFDSQRASGAVDELDDLASLARIASTLALTQLRRLLTPLAAPLVEPVVASGKEPPRDALGLGA